MAKKDEREHLANIISNSLKKDGIASYHIGEEETPTDLSDFISTGSSLLDLAISNRPNGGIACGRITELTGLEGSGKSLIAAHLMANVQKEGGVAVLIDTETAVNEDFSRSIGIDMSKLVYVPTEILEQVFETVEKIIMKVREGNAEARKKKVIIVIDSIAGASPKKELDGDFDQNGYATGKSIIISQAMRKLTGLIAREKIALVITNQLRMKMNAPAFADPYTTSGGKAIAFHSSTRVRLSQTGKIKNADKNVIGVAVNARIDKNRLGPPHRQVGFDVYFDSGIDDVSSWIKYLKDKGIVNGGAAGNYTYIDKDGVEHKFKSSTWVQFTRDNTETFAEIYNKMADTMIMAYKSNGISTLDGTAEVVSEVEDE
jgi:recombination protein RecA